MSAPEWANLLTSVLGEKDKMKLQKALKRTAKLALKEIGGKDGSKKVMAAQLQDLLSRGKLPGFQVAGELLRKVEVQEKENKEHKDKKKKKEKEKKRQREKTPEKDIEEETPVKRRKKKASKKSTNKDEDAEVIEIETKPPPVIISAPAAAPAAAGAGAAGGAAEEEDDLAWRASMKRTDVKSGPFSTAEKEAIRSGVAAFARARGFSTDDYSWILSGKGQRSADVLGLWKQVAAALPQRTIKSVAAAGNRMFHPDANKGKWTPEEDEELRAEVATHGNKWAAIGVRLGRPREACRLRWREIQLGDQKARGAWTVDEEQLLLAAVQEYLAAKKAAEESGSGLVVSMGDGNAEPQFAGGRRASTSTSSDKLDRRGVLDDIDWGVISKRVGTRSNIQCLEKWYDQLAPSMVERGDWGPGDDRRLLRALWIAAPDAEYEVKWGEVVGGRTAVQARRRWRLMAKAVPDNREKEFPELIDYLVTQYMPRLKEKTVEAGTLVAGEGGAS